MSYSRFDQPPDIAQDAVTAATAAALAAQAENSRNTYTDQQRHDSADVESDGVDKEDPAARIRPQRKVVWNNMLKELWAQCPELQTSVPNVDVLKRFVRSTQKMFNDVWKHNSTSGNDPHPYCCKEWYLLMLPTYGRLAQLN